MTSKQKAKGYFYEKKTEDYLNTINGVSAKRSVASGAYGRFSKELDGDVRANIHKDTYKVESKARNKEFPKWMENAFLQGDVVFFWKPRCEPVVAMPFEIFKKMIEDAEETE
ncbi:MAG TPA: hypothetical protein PK718_02080 [Candidatus Methanofastidiosa archaeon]|nr:hypothetical protein [Candidatus Methanofastidiosa archaeon]